MSRYLVKDSVRLIAELTNPRLLVTDKRIPSIQDLVPVLEPLVKSKEMSECCLSECSCVLLSVGVPDGVEGGYRILAPDYSHHARRHPHC